MARHLVRGRGGAAQPAPRRPGDGARQKRETDSEIRRQTANVSPRRQGATRTASSSRARTSTRSPRARASTTTARARPTTSSRRSRSLKLEHQAAKQDPLRVVGRRGVQPPRLAALRRQPVGREFAKIAANLNFDMIASPNFVRFVYDGNGSDTPRRPAGLGRDRAGLPRLVRLAGARDRADRVRRTLGLRAVHRARHPAGGLFTGAEGVKTQRRTRYGGRAGEAYEPLMFAKAISGWAGGIPGVGGGSAEGAIGLSGERSWPSRNRSPSHVKSLVTRSAGTIGRRGGSGGLPSHRFGVSRDTIGALLGPAERA